MKPRFNKNYFTTFIILFITEVGIALCFKDGFIRHTFGDFLVVILLYCFFMSFLKGNHIGIAAGTLVIAYIIEFLQRTDFLNALGLAHHKWAVLVFGNSFSVQDLFAYTLGIVVVLFAEKRFALATSY